MIEGLLDGIADLDAVWLLALAFFLPYGECVAVLDMIVPGELGLIIIGAAASTSDVPLLAVIIAGTFGAFLGDSTSWFIGHRWGTSFLTRWEPIRRRTEEPLIAAERHFERYGGPTVFGARFIGPLRALVPLVAGTTGMPYRRFVPWNALASAVWVTMVIVLGAVFGESLARILDDIGIGIGPVRKIHPKRVSLSTGPAFTCSGEALDEMPAKFRMNARLAEADAAVAGWIGAVVRLCDVVAGGWTARQAQIVGLALLHPGATHQDLADRLRPRASRQLVTKTLAANGWDGLAAALEQFEKFDWTSLST